MIDNAAIYMQNGKSIAVERVSSVNDNTMQSHFHAYYELFYLERGQRSVVVGDRSFILSPHEFIVFPPYIMHHSCSPKDVEFSRVVLYFLPSEIPAEIDLLLRQEPHPHELIDSKHKEELHKELCAIIEEQNQALAQAKNQSAIPAVPAPTSAANASTSAALSEADLMEGGAINLELLSNTAMQSRLRLLLITALRYQSKDIESQGEPKIAKIIKYIHNHYYQELSLDDLAEQFFISKYYLCREFKRFTACSFVEYLNKIRVLHAQRLFVESNKTITQIAIEVGFGSLTHFERVFFQHTALTPKKMCTSMRLMRDKTLPQKQVG